MTLEIDITSPQADEQRVTLRGRLDTLTTPELDRALVAALATPEVTALVFDLRNLEYISSAGVRCLIQANKAMAERGGHLAVLNPSALVRRVFEIVKALPPGQIFASEAELAAHREAAARRGRRQPDAPAQS